MQVSVSGFGRVARLVSILALVRAVLGTADARASAGIPHYKRLWWPPATVAGGRRAG
jgi:hypothetical protein